MLQLNLPAARSYNQNYTGFRTAGVEEANKALAIKMSLSIENGLIITGIRRRKEGNKNVINKQGHTVSLSSQSETTWSEH